MPDERSRRFCKDQTSKLYDMYVSIKIHTHSSVYECDEGLNEGDKLGARLLVTSTHVEASLSIRSTNGCSGFAIHFNKETAM